MERPRGSRRRGHLRSRGFFVWRCCALPLVVPILRDAARRDQEPASRVCPSIRSRHAVACACPDGLVGYACVDANPGSGDAVRVKLTSGIHPAYAQMRAGTFERVETETISRLLNDADVFVDVGANIGYYSLLALQRGKRVVAFEPQGHNLRAFYASLEANGWQDPVEVFPVALA
jgi:hypothetical protein